MRLYDYALMAKFAYQPEENNDPTQTTLTADQWQHLNRNEWSKGVFSTSCSLQTGMNGNSHLGYRGVLFEKLLPTGETILVISHCGTVLSKEDNIFSDIALSSNLTPQESKVAMAFTNYCIQQFSDKPNKKIIHVGHSLGGFHAHYCAYSTQAYAITFDNPGTHTQLIAMATDAVGHQNQLPNHLSILSEPNIINNHGARFGRVFQLNTRPPESEDLLNLEAHLLSFLLDRIPQDYVQDSLFPREEEIELPSGFNLMLSPRDGSKNIEDAVFTAKLKPKVTPIEFATADEVDNTGFQMPSSIAFKEDGTPEIVTSRRVLVHLACFGKSFGHSVIIVERITSEGEPLIGYYHLVMDDQDPEGKRASILPEEYSYHHYAKHYNPKKIASFERCNDDHGNVKVPLVDRMIESITEDCERAKRGEILYEAFTGGTFQFMPKGLQENCLTWAMEKLAIAEITPKNCGILTFAAKPKNVKPHGIAPRASVDGAQHHRPSQSSASLHGGSGSKGQVAVAEKVHDISSSRHNEACLIL